jgi:hypothetical protein
MLYYDNQIKNYDNQIGKIMTTLDFNQSVENALRMAVLEILSGLRNVELKDTLKSLSVRHEAPVLGTYKPF